MAGQAPTTMLSEEYVQDSFHSYVKSSLTHAKIENLLDSELLSSAQSDLMITGPALSLYFAALRSTTTPPSVPLPRPPSSSSQSTAQTLTTANCPQPFLPILHLWSATVPKIQALPPHHQHDLARTICALPPLANPPHPDVAPIAADLRALAIEISMRRSFQDRYAADLQAAIDAGPGAAQGVRAKASFVPPPSYESSAPPSLPHYHDATLQTPSPSTHKHKHKHKHSTHLSPPPTPSHSRTHSRSRSASPSPSPTLLPPSSPAISFIRETLYATLADILSSPTTASASLTRLLTTDPPRAYFLATSLALFALATTALTPAGTLRGVLGHEMRVEECVGVVGALVRELREIGRVVEEWDSGGHAGMGVGEGMEKVRRVLEEGVGRRVGGAGAGTGSVDEEKVVALANRINALSLAVTRMSTFRERQDEVFSVLRGVIPEE